MRFELKGQYNGHPKAEYKSISWHHDGALAHFGQLIQTAKVKGHGLVAILRGGGHWAGMQGFESRDLADLIMNSDVPVVTAVVHAEDVSLADRADVASCITPSAVAAAITTTFRAQKSQAYKARDEREVAQSQNAQRQDSRLIADLQTDVAEAKKAIGTLQMSATEQENHHIQTLLDMARRQVRGYSRLATAVAVVLAVAMFFGASGFLEFFGMEPSFRALLITRCTAILAAWYITWRLELGRQKIKSPAARPLRIPPTTAEWMAAIKNVRTVHGLQKLQRHLPPGAEATET